MVYLQPLYIAMPAPLHGALTTVSTFHRASTQPKAGATLYRKKSEYLLQILRKFISITISI